MSTVKINPLLTKDNVLSGIAEDWLKLLDTKLLDTILPQLKGPITPPPTKIFEFARLTELSKVKVVIIGQDPYPRAGDAHGLAFSCLTNIPGSLKNIFKCLLKHKLIEEIPETGNLEYWSKQGVLLLNRALTTQVGKPNKHADIWDVYTKELMTKITALRPLIVMLWGNNARELNEEPYIGPKATVYEWSHPSPMAQSKQSFVDCPHFVDANKALIRLGREPIDWNIAPPRSQIELAFGIGPATTVVFTDGSCMPNKSGPTSRGGYAATFALGIFKDVVLYGSIANRPTYASNQRAEGVAILRTMQYLEKHVHEWEEAIIVSDSDFWIKMFDVYMPAWNRKNGIDSFDEKKNPDLTKVMWTTFSALTDEAGKTITFRHMKSHNKENWAAKPEDSYEYFCYTNNEFVDQFATFARKTLEPGVDVEETANYDVKDDVPDVPDVPEDDD
jgi:uracil-DNA glycosylase